MDLDILLLLLWGLQVQLPVQVAVLLVAKPLHLEIQYNVH